MTATSWAEFLHGFGGKSPDEFWQELSFGESKHWDWLTDANLDDENAMEEAAPAPTLSEMRNVMKNII
ncbi:hypothetical protein TNCV_1755691 [Trichonephila clavipes]|nr:hypothetical protein TNCV_1755691 [Trichonephila clavipes]